MKKHQGLTLIEVLVAVLILGVGVIAAASMQTSSLRASSTARIVQEVTNVARVEIEVQRASVRTDTPVLLAGCELSLEGCQPTIERCKSKHSGYGCEVVVVPCRLNASGVLSCSMMETGTIVADHITVTAVGPQATEVELSTVVAR